MLEITLKVIPSASRDGIIGWYGDALKIKVAAPPERGKANRAVIDLLAQHLSITPESIQMVRGHRSNMKVVQIKGLAFAELNKRLGK